MTHQEIQALLDDRYRRYDQPSFIAPDPISLPHRYTRAQDIEISGLFAALLAWGKPHTLAGQLEERQRRVAALPPGRGTHALAVSQAAPLRAMAEGRPATPDRPARGPVRRHGFYLVIEGRDAAELRRTVDDLVSLYGAARCAGA